MPGDLRAHLAAIGRDLPELPQPPRLPGELSVQRVVTGHRSACRLDQRLGSPIGCLEVDAAGGLAIAGTDSAFDNTFLVRLVDGSVERRLAVPGRWVHQVAFAAQPNQFWTAMASAGRLYAYDLAGQALDDREAATPVSTCTFTHFHHHPPYVADAPYVLVDHRRGLTLLNLAPGRIVCQDRERRILWSTDYREPGDDGSFTTLRDLALSDDGATLACAFSRVTPLSTSHNGATFAGCRVDDRCDIRVLSAETGEPMGRFGQQLEAKQLTPVSGIQGMARLALSPDGHTLALSLGRVTLFTDRQGKELGRVQCRSAFENYRAEFSPDGQRVALWPIEGQAETRGSPVSSHALVLYRMTDGEVTEWAASESVCDLDWLSDSTSMAISRWDGSLTRLALDGSVIWTTDLVLGAKLKVLSDGRILAGTAAGRLALVSPQGKQLWTTNLHHHLR